MRKIIILLLALMSFFSFSKNYEKKEDKRAGISSTALVLKEGTGNSYDFSFDYVMLGSMPRLRQLAGTAYKNGNKYIFQSSAGDRIEFNIKNNKVTVSGNFDSFVNGEYTYTSESTNDDYEGIEWIKENIMPD